MTRGPAATATYKSARCAICKAVVIVRKQPGVPASLLRSLAMADHILALHDPLPDRLPKAGS